MILKLTAENRHTEKKSERRAMRAADRIPAVMYGFDQKPLSISVDKLEFMRLYRKGIGELAFFEVELDGEKYKTIIRDKQVHPVTRNFLHVDFMVLSAGKKLTLEIPIHYVGEAKGIKEGGMLDVLIYKLQIACLPRDIPEDVQVDVAHLGLGEAVHVNELEIPNCEILNASDAAMVIVHTPKGAESDTGAEEEETEEESAE